MANIVCEISMTRAPLAKEGSDIPGVGAFVDFWGLVRPIEDDRKIEGLDYEAHGQMAEHQLKRIAEQAAQQPVPHRPRWEEPRISRGAGRTHCGCG